ncbi:P-loop containing nucleoside triphosphate hydrolase [Phytophthora cactorum]|nr:P-loop containing nucleoside triphosphate hydrolase [Phytophthora cactorum]
MAANSLKIMFLGAPGAGKGTYASRIAPMLQIPTISTGDLIKTYNNSGALVPDQIILDMMETRLAQDDAKRGFILDGFPRNVPQAEAFQQVTKLDLVVNIDLPQWILSDKISGRRSGVHQVRLWLQCGLHQQGEYHMPPLLPKVEGICDSCGAASLVQRPDDSPETVKQRLEVYNQETAPLIDFYTKLGNLKTFEVKKGLADLDKLVALINAELHA